MPGSSRASTISSFAIQDYVEMLKLQRYKSSMRKSYYSAWRTFNEFFVQLDVRPKEWEDRLTLFVGYLIRSKHKSATINSYVSAIKAVLREDKVKISEDRFLLSSLIRACKVKNDRVKARLPIQGELLWSILRQMQVMFDQQQYLAKLYKAMAMSAYFGMLRIGEIAKSQHTIMAKDLRIGRNKNKIMYILRSSKTHAKSDHLQIVKISQKVAFRSVKKEKHRGKSQSIEVCPYTILREYVGIRPWYRAFTEQFFVFSDNAAITPEHFRNILRKCLAKIGLDVQLYDTHSLRIGRTVDLLALGYSVETIKKLGRWKSNAVFANLRNY